MSHTISHNKVIIFSPAFSLFLFLIFAVTGYAVADTDAGSLLRQQEQLEEWVPGWLPEAESEEPKTESEEPKTESEEPKTESEEPVLPAAETGGD